MKLTGSTDNAAAFGTSVAVSGDGNVVLVGAPFDSRRKRGTAWIFRRAPGGGWVRQRLTGEGEAGQSAFGWAVALSDNGSTAIVGGPLDSGQKGAAWVFVRSGSTWRQQGGKLTKGGDLGADRFGESVSVSGDGRLALVGGPRDEGSTGAVWVFARSGSKWRQRGNKMRPAGPPARGFFGFDVALGANGTIALIGQPGIGSVTVLTRAGSEWRRRPRLDGPTGFGFGQAVALSVDGRAASVGVNYSYDGTGVGRFDVRGQLYSCSSLGCLGAPEPLTLLRARGGSDPPRTGAVAVANGGDTVVVGAPGQQTREPTVVGHAWAFVRWPLVQRMSPRHGPTGGGTVVTIRGQNFTSVRGVHFTRSGGSTPAAQFTVESPTVIRATSPPEPPGSGDVHVRVQTPVGMSPRGETGGWYVADDVFIYVARPTVTSITPVSGPTNGGTEVTITGRDFDRFTVDGNVVRFGARTALSVRTVSATELRAVSPAANAGSVDVTVTTAGGASAPSAASRFTYVAPPAPETVIGFDNLTTGGPGELNAQTVVSSQYAAQGVTFNDVHAIDYSKGAGAIGGFARSGSIGIEQCVGVEFCTSEEIRPERA